MSYANPDVLVIATPIGIDRVIKSIQGSLATLTWLTKSFGRAWEFKEKDSEDKDITVPKCFEGTDSIGTGEYINVLPNDNLIAQSFIACISEERWIDFEFNQWQTKERDLRIIFWFNLKQIDPTKTYIFTEVLKNDVEKVLKRNKYMKQINNYYDEKVQDIFAGYSINDVKTQYLMHPMAGMRFDITVGFGEEC